MHRFLLAVLLCAAPLAAPRAQTSERGTDTSPAPVPSVPPPSAQTGGGNVPPERIAPVQPGAVGAPPSAHEGANMHDRDAPQSSVPAQR